MTLSVGRLATLAAVAMGAVTVLALGLLAFNGLHAAEDAAARGEAESARQLRLVATLLVVTLFFLAGIALLLAAHVAALVQNPLDELQQAIARIRSGGFHERIVPHGPEEVRRLMAEVNRLAATLAHRHGRLEEMVEIRTIDGLIYGVAHEVHTPLTTLILDNHLLERQIRLLHERGDLPAPVRGDLEKAALVVQRSRSVHGRLEQLTRSLREAVRTDPVDTERDVNLIVSAAVAIAHHRTPGGARVDTRLDATRRIECVAPDVFHALHGLLLQASEGVDPDGTVTVTTQDVPDGIQIGIRYTGTPVAPEILEILDDPTLSEEDLPALQLKAVHRFIDDCGGRLRYDTDGTRESGWTIWLPFSPP